VTTSLNNEIARATSAENNITSNLNSEISRAQGAESTITSNLNSEISRATAAENNLSATKANLAGGNTFSGGKQTLAASTSSHASLNVPDTGSAPSTPVAGDVWLTNANTHLQFLDKNNATHSLMFTDDPISNGQLTNSSINVSLGSGLSGSSSVSLGGTLNLSNTGVLSFNGRNGAVSPASGDYSFGQISGTFSPAQAGAGTYGIDISGNAATATLAANATNAANASLLSGEAAATAATASTIAARDASGDLFANVFHGSGASLTNIPTSALPASVVYNNQANTYSAGSKQTFKASASLAGLSFDGGATADPTTLASGDVWFNTTTNHLKFFDGTTTKTLAFGDDSISSAQVSGTYTNAVTFNNASNSFSGSGAGLTALNASNVSTGTLVDARLSANVPLLNGTQTFSGVNTFSSASNSFTGSGAGLTSLNPSNLSQNSASSGQVLAWSGTAWTPSTVTFPVTSVFGRSGAVTATSGDYSVAQVTGAAPLASPALTGTPTAPTASAGTNSTQLATTAYVNNPNNLFSAVNSQTATYTVLAGDQGKLITFSNAGTQTVSLPVTVPTAGWWIDFENTGAGTVTLSPNGHNLDGSVASLSIATNQGLRVVSNGTNYFTQRGVSSSSNFSGTLGVGNGGTGSSTAPSSGQILVGNTGGTAYAPQTVSGDCVLTNAGAITCTKTNGTSFAASATTDTTNAGNITSGTLSTARGGTGVTGAAVFPTSGTVATTTTAVGGDLTGTISSATVAKINNTTLGTLTGAATGQVLSWNGTSWVPATLSSSGGLAGGQVTLTTAQVGTSVGARTCATDANVQFTSFSGLTNTMAVVMTPVGALANGWESAGLSWVPYFVNATTIRVHVCNVTNQSTSLSGSQTFNIRFIN